MMEKNSHTNEFLPRDRIRTLSSFGDDVTDEWGVRILNDNDDYVLTYTDNKHTEFLAAHLNTYRKNRELCDVILFVKEHEIVAHKVVLAAISPSLFDMFKGQQQTSPDNSSDVTPRAIHSQSPMSAASGLSYFEFPHGDFDCFEALVNFGYTSCLEISNRKMAELYRTASALRVQTCAKACAKYLATTVAVSTCIGIRKCANFTSDLLLSCRIDNFIQDNFPEIVEKSVEFAQLSCIKVRIILCSDKSQREGGNSRLAEKTLQWFQTNLHQQPESRHDMWLEQLADKQHLLYLEEDQTLQDCADMDDHSLVGSCDLVQDYKRANCSRRSANASRILDPPVTTSLTHVNGATPMRINASRVGANRYSSCESLSSISSVSSETSDEIVSRLIAVTQISEKYWVALAILHRRLVALSIQLNENEELGRTSMESPAERSTSLARLVSGHANSGPLAQMNQARCSVGAVFLNQNIVVCGGYDRGECLKTVEQYDFFKGNWIFLPSMLTERGRFDAVVCEGKLYAVAGSNGNNDLASVECFNPMIGRWNYVASLKLARSNNGCATVNGFIYCIGGCNERNILRQCERYSPERDEWEAIASLNIGRFQAGCTYARNSVIACGGSDRWNCLDSVEMYDPRINQWKSFAPLRTARRGCAVAAINEDRLYVIGGSDGTQSLNSVEVLDFNSNQWQPGPSLTSARANVHAVVTSDGSICAIGGFDGKQFLSTIEILEPGSNEWRNWQLPCKDQWTINEDPIGEEIRENLEQLNFQ